MILLFASILCAGQALAFQAQVRDVSAVDFLLRSETVFWGSLLSSESFVPAGGGTIMTRHTFRVSGWVKGTRSPTVEVLEYGGQVGEEALIVSHQARYNPDQAYLVFSTVDGLGYRRTLGGPWGALPVISEASGGPMVRLPGRHPLRNGLDFEPGLFLIQLDQLVRQLETAMESLPHEAH